MIMSCKDWFMNLMKLTDYSLFPLCQNNDSGSAILSSFVHKFFFLPKNKEKK